MVTQTKEQVSAPHKELVDALVQPDPYAKTNIPLGRDLASNFAKTLFTTLNICTRDNIKECSSFIIQHIAPSPVKTAALIKFFLSVSKSLEPRDIAHRIDTTEADDYNLGLGKIVQGRIQQPPHPAAKRLFILYIISDVFIKLYMDWLDHESLPKPNRFKKQFFPHLLILMQLAAFQTEPADSVAEVIDIWARFQRNVDIIAFEQSELRALHIAEYCGRNATDWTLLLEKVAEEEKKIALRDPFQFSPHWTLPERHGQPHWPGAPPHELPAANGLFLKRTYGSPINMRANPPGGQKIIDAGHEADGQLQKDVSRLYVNMIRCFDKWTDPDDVKDIDPLGNKIYHDHLDRPTVNYWGNPYESIEPIRQIEKDAAAQARGYAHLPLQPGWSRPPPPRDHRGSYHRGGRGGRGDRGGGWAPRGRGRAEINDAIARARALAENAGAGGGSRGGGDGFRPARQNW